MKMVVVFGFLVLVVALAFFNQAWTNGEVKREYLHENRPDVIAAIDAYHAANGHYPDALTNAVPRYYHGNQERVFFLKSYAYQNLGSNYHLKRFAE